MEKKKNSKHYIIPASYFKKKGITPIPVKTPPKNQVEEPQANVQTQTVPNKKVEQFQAKQPPKIELNKDSKRTSGLSLKSIREKKAHQIKQMEVVVNEEDLPKEPFTEKEFIRVWKAYIDKITAAGQHNLASILSIDQPKIKGTIAHLEYPNETNKVEVERQQYELLGYIRKELNNFDINLSITINEVKEKQYAYTPFEKFEKLKEKNPNIDMLRKAFDLDV